MATFELLFYKFLSTTKNYHVTEYIALQFEITIEDLHFNSILDNASIMKCVHNIVKEKNTDT